MKFFYFSASAHFLRSGKTPKRISNIKIFDTFFKARDRIPPQLLKITVVSMPKRVFEVNSEKWSLRYISRPHVLGKTSISNDFPRILYDGLIILSGRSSDFFGYVPLNSPVESACMFSSCERVFDNFCDIKRSRNSF